MAETLGPAESRPMRQKLVQLPPPQPHPTLGRQDWLGALAVFLWVFVMTLPVALPFLFMHNVARAMRISNAIAIALLFVAGFAFGRVAEYRPWLADSRWCCWAPFSSSLLLHLGDEADVMRILHFASSRSTVHPVS